MNDRTFPQATAPRADQRIDTSKLLEPDGDFMKEFERIVTDQFGIKITNLSGHRIGFSKALPWRWKPKTEFRETLRGRLTKYEVSADDEDKVYDSSSDPDKKYREEEYDWCLSIEPASLPFYEEKFPADVIPGKVTPGENFRDTYWFPLKAGELMVDFSEPQRYGNGYEWSKPSPLLGYEICIYGPYVIVEGYDDDGHEIHPIDAIWWREGNNQVKVILLQDAAKGRFREEGMFEKDSRDDHFPEWKPWIEYPQLEEIRIPFIYDPQDEKYWHIIVEVNAAMDITTRLQPDLQDSDAGAQHQLLQAGPFAHPDVVQAPILVRVTEEKGFDNRHIAVQFPLTDLTRDAQGVIRGYVQLVAALGDKLNKHEGVLELTLTFKQEDNRLVAHP